MGITAKLRKEKIKGGGIISRMLATEGVETVFGIIDGSYFGFYSTLEQNGIQLVTPRTEASGVHMAGAYARLTGKLGVCMASNGPGVASVLPGVAVENAEGHRVLLITSSRREGITYPDRGGTFQHFPQVDVIRPMSKFSETVPTAERVAEIMRKALRACFTGRPGLVHVDVPESIMNGKYPVDPTWFREPGQYRMAEPLIPSESQVERAAKMLVNAELPLIQAGTGVVHAGAFEEVAALASLLEAPITTSWGARSALDERSPNAVPLPYVEVVNQARRDADLVLCLGSRLGETDWWGSAPYWAPPERQELIQVDIDPETLGTIRPTDLPVQSDIKEFLGRLIKHLNAHHPVMDLDRRRDHLIKIKQACRLRREELDQKLVGDSRPMASPQVVEACQAAFDDEDILVIDGGNTAIWANFYHEVRSPNTVVTTTKMGMLGAGLAQALGAAVARPQQRVYALMGDGAMGFQSQEIETAVRHGLPVIFIVLCDKQWGMVKMNQQFALKPVKTLLLKSLGPDETINTDLCEIRWDEVARAMGAHGERVAEPHELRAALKRAKAAGRVAVIHVDVDPVKHLWAPNLKTFKDMHEEPKG